MSALEVKNIEKYELQDEFDTVPTSSDIVSDWHSFESTFKIEYYKSYKNIVNSADLVSNLLHYGINDDDLDASFTEVLQNQDCNSENEDLISGGTSIFDTNSSDKKVLDQNENYLSEIDAKPASLSTAEDAPVTSEQKKSKAGRKRSKKKSSDVPRTVVTETIFNGSIADIVKTRKRGVNKDDSEFNASHDLFYFNSKNDQQVDSSSLNYPTSSLEDVEDSDEYQNYPMPKIKLNKSEVIKEKKSRKKRKAKNSPNSDISTDDSVSQKNVSKKKPKKEIVDKFELNPSFVQSASTLAQRSSDLLVPKTEDKSDFTEPEVTTSPELEIKSSDSSPEVDNAPVKTEVSVVPEKELDKPKNTATVEAPAKKKLRGLEEYKAHKARLNQENKLSSSSTENSATAPNTVKHRSILLHLQKHLNARKKVNSYKPPIQKRLPSPVIADVPNFIQLQSENGAPNTHSAKSSVQSSPSQPSDMPISSQLQSASHDIQSPVNSISSSCDNMIIEPDDNGSLLIPISTPGTSKQFLPEGQSSRKSSNKSNSNVATKKSQPHRSLSPSDSSSCESGKRRSRNRYASRSESISSESNCSSKRRYSPDYRKSSYYDNRRHKFRSKPKTSPSSSRYSDHCRETPNKYNRKRSPSRERRSYSRRSSSSDSDFIYAAYGSSKISRSRPSVSPVRGDRPSNSGRNRESSPSRTSRHSSGYYTHNEHSRYSVSPDRRRYRRSSSRSTASSYSRRATTSSSSRSISRERSHHRNRSSRSSHSSRKKSYYEEQQKKIEERRVVYVGVIPDGYTKTDLHERFACFGAIEDVRIHNRNSRRNDNYGFITFRNKQDAYKAVEEGNEHPLEPKFGISFGGRRRFCRQRYSDLDKENEVRESRHPPYNSQSGMSFDNLLRNEMKRVNIRTKHRRRS